MFHITWTTFKFSKNQLGMVSAYVMISMPGVIDVPLKSLAKNHSPKNFTVGLRTTSRMVSDGSVFNHIFPHYTENCVHSELKLCYVSVNSNWVHLPGNPQEIFWSKQIPATRAIFCLSPCPRAKMIVEFPRVGQNFPKLEETAP